MITDNKRAFKRIRKKIKIRYCSGSEPKIEYSSESKNISMGGVYFVAIKKVDIGEVLICRLLDAQKNISLEVEARVVRCELLEKHMVDTFGLAAEFININSEKEKNLKNLISV